MPRKKKSPASVTVEAVYWRDAFGAIAEKLDINPCYRVTCGAVVHEDNEQIILAADIRSTEDWMDNDMDYTKIPLVLIYKRIKLGEVQVQLEEEVKDVDDTAIRDGTEKA